MPKILLYRIHKEEQFKKIIILELEKLGYEVISSDSVPLEKSVLSNSPDLVFLPDGLIEREKYCDGHFLSQGKLIPVVFVVDTSKTKNGEDKPFHYLEKSFSTRELHLIVEASIYNKKLERDIWELKNIDYLTGLYNRFFWEKELKRLDDDKKFPLCIVMGDVKGLKLVNDVFGYNEGDKFLLRVANILTEVARTNDILARWSGDEFAFLMPFTQEEIALEITKEIKNKCDSAEAIPIKLGLALGVACKTDQEKDVETVLKKAEADIYKHKISEAEDFRNDIIAALLRRLGEKDYETEEHAWRMQSLAVQFGSYIELDDNEMNNLVLVTTLHDIGKIAVPEEVLMKPGSLTKKEWEIIKEHSERGYHIALSSGELTHLAPNILAHHERWDGNGYPMELKGEEIPLLARIISIIDTYDVMTNQRPYKKTVTSEEALQEIEKCAGTQFDPTLAKEFVQFLKESAIESVI